MGPIISAESLFIPSGKTLNKQFPLVLYLVKVAGGSPLPRSAVCGVFIAVLVWFSGSFFCIFPQNK